MLVQLGGPDFGWRLVFYVNLPIGLLLLVLARRWLPVAAEGRRQSLDPVGVLLFAAAMVLILLPVVEGKQGQPLSHRPWWLLGVSAGVLLVFISWERFWAGRGQETLVDLALGRVPSYVFGVVLGSLYFAGFTSIFIILTLYLQNGLDYSALEAGLTQMPFAVGSAVSAFLAGRVVARFGRALVVTGLVVISAGLVVVDLLVPHLDGAVGWKLAPLLLLCGAGGGMVIAPNITLSLDEVDPSRAGAGGGLLQTAQRVGSAIGVAVVLAEFFDRLSASHGDFTSAFSTALHTTVGLILAALLLGLVDLARRRRGVGAAEEEAGRDQGRSTASLCAMSVALVTDSTRPCLPRSSPSAASRSCRSRSSSVRRPTTRASTTAAETGSPRRCWPTPSRSGSR